jgi:hypothetical protein
MSDNLSLRTNPLPTKPEWLRASFNREVSKPDREKGIIPNVILAEEGPFKSEGRGEFDRKAIRAIVKMANDKPNGLKVRWTHPGLSSDGLGKFLGRQKNVRADTVLREVGKDADGKPLMKERLVARGDLHLDSTALVPSPESGGKPYGLYVMDLAESDHEAFGTSLVLKVNQETRIDKQGRPMKDDTGNELPPLWYPTELHASDIVDDGDATHSFLSADILASLPDAIVRKGCELLDAQFPNQPREVVKARLSAFVERYLSHRYGEELSPDDTTIDEPEPATEESPPATGMDWRVAEMAIIEAEGE